MRPSVVERIWSHIERDATTGCWMFRLVHKESGYGAITVGYRARRAHRVVYELLVEPIPDGLVLDHLCRRKACVNPAHLEPVTQQENMRRGLVPSTVNARKTHCAAGHPFDDENTYRDKRGHRSCRACHRLKSRLMRADRRAKAGAV